MGKLDELQEMLGSDDPFGGLTREEWVAGCMERFAGHTPEEQTRFIEIMQRWMDAT